MDIFGIFPRAGAIVSILYLGPAMIIMLANFNFQVLALILVAISAATIKVIRDNDVLEAVIDYDGIYLLA